MASEIKEIVTDGSFTRRVERAAGDSEAEWMRKTFPTSIPDGYFFGYRWIAPNLCEFGIFQDTPETRAAVPFNTAGNQRSEILVPKVRAEDLSLAQLREKAAENNVEVSGKTNEQLVSEVNRASANKKK